MNVSIFGPVTIDPTGTSRGATVSNGWYYTPSQIVTATVAIGDVSPATPVTVTLSLRQASTANYQDVATLATGALANKTYRFVFRMADYLALGEWWAGVLTFRCDPSQPVTGQAWVDGAPAGTIDASGLGDYADDAAAAAGGIAVGGLYRNINALQVRVS